MFLYTNLSSYFSVDGDSADSISECRGLSPTITEMSISTTSTASSSTNKMNGISSMPSMNRNNSHQQINQRSTNGGVAGALLMSPTVATTSATATNGYHHYQNGTGIRSGGSSHSKMMTSLTESGSSSCSNSSMNKLSNNGDIKYCDMNGSSNKDSGGQSSNNIPNGSQGSPLRSQLGLNLKTNKPASNKQSPLQVNQRNLLENNNNLIMFNFSSVQCVHIRLIVRIYLKNTLIDHILIQLVHR